MEMIPTKIAFDLGGVILHREAEENHLIPESILSVRLTVQKFKAEHVYIISKAKDKYKQRNLDLLIDLNFFKETGMKIENVYFVNEYEDKGVLGKQLGIKYIIDDTIKIAKFAKEYGFCCILFGDHQQFLQDNPDQFMHASSWKAYRKILQRIK